jgi:hypothetical protein
MTLNLIYFCKQENVIKNKVALKSTSRHKKRKAKGVLLQNQMGIQKYNSRKKGGKANEKVGIY